MVGADQRGRLYEIQIALAFFMILHAIVVPWLSSPADRRRLIGHVVLTLAWLGITAMVAAIYLPSRVRWGLSLAVWTYLLLVVATFVPVLRAGPALTMAVLIVRAVVAFGLEAGVVTLREQR